MQSRRSNNQPPQLLFTKDFGQLVKGNPSQGACEICYDAIRLVPKEDFTNPRPVTLHANLYPSGTKFDYHLDFIKGHILNSQLTGQAEPSLMLTARILTPLDFEEIEIWFSYQDQNGNSHCDSNFGRNYWLRFPLRDIQQISASLEASTTTSKDASANFFLQVLTSPKVSAISARWRLPNSSDPFKHYERPLSRKVTLDEPKSTHWQFSEDQLLPFGAPAVFELTYTVAGRSYIDDNEGSYYLADHLAYAGGLKTLRLFQS